MRSKKITVTIERTIQIDVTVGHFEGVPQSWHEQGEPEEFWIEQSVQSDTDEIIEIDDIETQTSIDLAMAEIENEKNQTFIDDIEDESKPF